MDLTDLVSKQREAAHKFADSNNYPPFDWKVESDHMEMKDGIPQGNIRYSFYDDDNDLKYEGDIRIFEDSDGLVKQYIVFKLVD